MTGQREDFALLTSYESEVDADRFGPSWASSCPCATAHGGMISRVLSQLTGHDDCLPATHRATWTYTRRSQQESTPWTARL